MKMKSDLKIFLTAVLLLVLGSQSGYGYYQEVGAQADEVFQAALQVLGEDKIDRVDREKLEIESKWFEDITTRRHKSLIIRTKQKFLRRTRYRISLKAWPRYTEITIRADLQFKTDDDAKMAPWRSLKPQRQDVEQEGALFHKIIEKLAANRLQQPSAV